MITSHFQSCFQEEELEIHSKAIIDEWKKHHKARDKLSEQRGKQQEHFNACVYMTAFVPHLI